jgi:hypothetical protein
MPRLFVTLIRELHKIVHVLASVVFSTRTCDSNNTRLPLFPLQYRLVRVGSCLIYGDSSLDIAANKSFVFRNCKNSNTWTWESSQVTVQPHLGLLCESRASLFYFVFSERDSESVLHSFKDRKFLKRYNYTQHPQYLSILLCMNVSAACRFLSVEGYPNPASVLYTAHRQTVLSIPPHCRWNPNHPFLKRIVSTYLLTISLHTPTTVI